MRIFINILLFTLLISCSTDQLTLKQYANHQVYFDKQQVIYPNNDFSLLIPKNWYWKVETYDNDKIILGINAGSEPDKNGFIDLISIIKLKSFGGHISLKSEFEYVLDLTKQRSKIIECGESNILKQKAYFIHAKSDSGTYGEAEFISFILESKTKGVFYYLDVSASQTSELKNNMAILIQSLKTFETQSIE